MEQEFLDAINVWRSNINVEEKPRSVVALNRLFVTVSDEFEGLPKAIATAFKNYYRNRYEKNDY